MTIFPSLLALRELVARVKTVFRRFKPEQAPEKPQDQASNKITCGDIDIFPDES